MAKNTGQGYRKGQVTGRSQFRSAGSWRKRDTVGRIIATAKERSRESVESADQFETHVYGERACTRPHTELAGGFPPRVDGGPDDRGQQVRDIQQLVRRCTVVGFRYAIAPGGTAFLLLLQEHGAEPPGCSSCEPGPPQGHCKVSGGVERQPRAP